MKDLLVFLDGTSADEDAHRSGGSTGQPSRCLPDRAVLQCPAGSHVRIRGWHGLDRRGFADCRTPRAPKVTPRPRPSRPGSESCRCKNEVQPVRHLYQPDRPDGRQRGPHGSDVFIATRPLWPLQFSHAEAHGTGAVQLGARAACSCRRSASRNAYDTVVCWPGATRARRPAPCPNPYAGSGRKPRRSSCRHGVGRRHAREKTAYMPGADISRYLSRHGVTVPSCSDARPTGRNVGEALLNEVEQASMPILLVMGGYGHSRFREWVLGGATRDILTRAELPVFIAH